MITNIDITHNNLLGTMEYQNEILRLASQEGRTDTVKTLLANGADANAQNSKQKTPLHRAV